MSRRLARDERGFTLIELLVVILVIGILAAIALPMFLGQTKNAGDADAKSNARNLVSQVDSCFAVSEDYRDCATEAELGTTGLPWGTGPGQVRVTTTTKTTFEIEAISAATTAGANHVFTIDGGSSGDDFSCTAGPGNDAGACRNGAW